MRRRCAGAYTLRGVYFTVMQVQRESWQILCETLPISSPLISDSPRLPMTIASAPFCWAESRMHFTGSPSGSSLLTSLTPFFTCGTLGVLHDPVRDGVG